MSRAGRRLVASVVTALAVLAGVTGTWHDPTATAEQLALAIIPEPPIEPEPPFVLSETAKADLRSERFRRVTAVARLPWPVRSGLRRLIGEPFLHMADPNEPFQETDFVVDGSLPWRRLLLAGVGSRHSFVLYESGGFAPSLHLVVLRHRAAGVDFLWGGQPRFVVRDVADWTDLLEKGMTYTASSYW